MKQKILYIAFLLSVIITSCQKDEVNQSVIKQDFTLGIEIVSSDMLKGGLWDYQCLSDEEGKLYEPAIAEIELKDSNGVSSKFYPAVFFQNNKLYTQAIKLETGTYSITKFILWNDHPLTGNNPQIIMATPEKGSDFSEYVSEGLDIDFSIESFRKAEIEIDVLCFMPQMYNSFGFTWYEITEIVVREFCFFGDICANGSDGNGSQEETAWGGDYEGSGSAWWYYFDTEGPSEQAIYAGQQLTDGTITYLNGEITIDLGSWSLQNVDEPVKIQGYSENELPVSLPSPGLLNTYKGNQLTVTVPHFRYYAIHLDVALEESLTTAEAPYIPDDFAGSDYENVPGGLQTDMPAIFKIHVYRNGLEMPNSPFSNLGVEDQPLCVKYPDRIRISDEEFTFELFVLVPDGQDGFHYKYYHTFSSIDDGPLDTEDLEDDGVIDFVLGNCNYSPADLQLSWD